MWSDDVSATHIQLLLHVKLDKTGDLSFFQQQDMIVCCSESNVTCFLMYKYHLKAKKRGKTTH